MSSLIDITPPVRLGMAAFPGDESYQIRQTFALSPTCPVNVAAFSMSCHCGAHADAPLHYDDNGLSIDALSLEDFIGPARVIDARGDGAQLLPEDLDGLLEDVPPRVLLRLTDGLDPCIFPEDFRTISKECVALLASKGVRLIGVDAPSVDPATSKTLDAHMAVRKFDMRILENLVLNNAESGDYELIALPMKLEGLDAAPVRAILRGLAR